VKKTLQDLLRVLSRNLPDISFKVKFWDGDTEHFGEGESVFTIAFTTKQAAQNVVRKGTLGFGEEYTAGNIEVEGDFRQLLRLGMDPRFQNIELPLRTKAAVLIYHFAFLNSLKRSPRNIAHHYDLGNDFYKLYLDESMTYSCAYFRTETDTLEQAQWQKYEHICRKLQLRRGETLLDVGCGWGGMLIHAARHYGTKGVGCTLSVNQTEYAKERVAQAGLEEDITILREDYRNVTGRFDKFVSIGMFEHVGKGFASTFMEKTRALLKPGGIGLLHTIGKEQDTVGDAWTMRYIFPGAYVPILGHVTRAMGVEGLVPIDVENLRLHYAATLDEWARRFESNTRKIEEMCDQRLVRMWRFYLNGSAAAFRWGDIRLYQILFTNGINNSLPMTREHVYAPILHQ
jgi:cyclopropane-fatty-acyl-phospholipid synthase